MEKLFSCKTAAEHFSMSEAYFRALLKFKEIPGVKMGYSIRMKKSDLDAHFEAKIANSVQTA